MGKLFFVVLIATSINQDKPISLSRFLARQDYELGASYFLNQIHQNPSDLIAIKNLARIYEHAHRFDSSLFWWEEALKLKPDDDSALLGRWRTVYQNSSKDSATLDSIRKIIAAEAQSLLSETTYSHLFLAYHGLSLADENAAQVVGNLLINLFPDSALSYQLLGNMFYDSLYPVWNNDTLKIPLISRFIHRYPRTEWRQTFYLFLLSSIFALKDTDQLAKVASEMCADDTLDPFRYRYAAALFNRLRFRPKTAETYARRALLLAPKAKKPGNKPIEQWQLEYPPLYGLSCAALAEALILQNQPNEALPYLKKALKQFRWDTENEATPAPFHCLLGEIYEHLNDPPSARLCFVKALVCGDSRNYWSTRADSGLNRLGITPADQLALARKLLNYQGPVFTDVTESIGLAGRYESRVAWGDYNNDGFEDLLLNGSRLFRNDSGKHFTDVTDSVGLTNSRGRGGVWADFNNDYWLDFYSCGTDTVDRLYKNHFGNFKDVTDSVGSPSDPYPTEGAAFADFDNDGWVDLYCANYENWETHTYFPDRLYKNEHGVFKDVTQSANIIPPYAQNLAGRGVNWGDFDDDGFPDCYVSNYRLCQNLLWHNNRNGTFFNLAPRLGVAGEEVNGYFGHTIGSVWGDYDNDCDLDLFVANLAHPRYIEFSNRSCLYENRRGNAEPRFIDRRRHLGIRYEETHSDPVWADVDNDGDLDLYITSVYENRRSFLYLNELIPSPKAGNWKSLFGDYKFIETTYLSGTRAFNGWGCAFADFDNDGDMDLVVGSGSGLRLFRNDTKNQNHWLKVRVVGTKHNAAGIGARIIVKQGKNSWIREVEGGKGTTSQNSLIQHFGLGRSVQPVTVEVHFAPNSTVILKNIPPDQLITVTEP
ncbi:MAG: FG-GAP-like repeat-containing protein [candidate division WOR-3 bacterium]